MKFIAALRDKGMFCFFISLNLIKSIRNLHTLDQWERRSRSLEGPSVRLYNYFKVLFVPKHSARTFHHPIFEKPSSHYTAGNTAFSLESWASRAPWSLPVTGLRPLVSSFWLHLRFCYLPGVLPGNRPLNPTHQVSLVIWEPFSVFEGKISTDNPF